MSESTPKIYLIAGASRGIGLALIADIASKDPSAIIYAGVRNTSGAELIELAAKYPGRIEIVKFVAGDKEGNDALAKEIGGKHGRIDTVIANAGINNCDLTKVHEQPVSQFEDHFSVNVIGPIILFQSVRSLLKTSQLPRFIPISSMVGSLELVSKAPDIAPYGTSKAALNWVTRKIHFENDWLVTFPICPGAVDTDMAKGFLAKDKSGTLAERFKGVWRSPSLAAGMLVDIITVSTREKDGGQFRNTEETTRYPW